MFSKIIQFKLKILAKLILARHKPKVVAITGSHGKTSTKEACYYILKEKFKVRRAVENFNNEYGVPLVILGVNKNPGKNPLAWLGIFFQGLKQLLAVNYPEVLILEMGADRPGDIKYLMSIVQPDVGVLTGIGRSHIEFFGSVRKICQEKKVLLDYTKDSGSIVLNMDDVEVCNDVERKVKGQSKIIKAGFSDRAKLRGTGFNYLEFGAGVSFDLNYQGKSQTVKMPLVFGSRQALAGVLASGVGLVMGLDLQTIANSLADFKPPKSRMNLIEGIKKSWILDDTYNASPHSTVAAFETLKSLGKSRRKILILGDMLELGPETENCHRGLARKFVDWLDLLITVGDRANFTSDEALKLGMPKEKVLEYDHLEPLLTKLERIIRPNDLILIKGSQGARMEKAVKDIMAEPLRAPELVTRQAGKWLKS